MIPSSHDHARPLLSGWAQAGSFVACIWLGQHGERAAFGGNVHRDGKEFTVVGGRLLASLSGLSSAQCAYSEPREAPDDVRQMSQRKFACYLELTWPSERIVIYEFREDASR